MEILTTEESVFVHRKDGRVCAVTIFNGHSQLFAINEPMGRKEQSDFYETNTI